MHFKKLPILFFALIITQTNLHAQIFNKIKQKAVGAIENKIDGKPAAKAASAAPDEQGGNSKTYQKATTVFDFTPGATTFFSDSFAVDQPGRMPKHWKSSGSGSLVNFPGVPGKWMLMQEFTSYKLDTLMSLPANCTVEFDILTRADQAKDLSDFKFGLSHDNSVADYTSDAYNDNAITQTQIHYWNKSVLNSSSDTKAHNTIDFPLTDFANAVMHVSMEINGTQMKVYLDQTKVLDTRMLNANSVKYFYLSTSTNMTNNAQIAVGNFVFKK